MIVKDFLQKNKKVMLRGIRHNDYLEPSEQQLKNYENQWSPGAIEKGDYVIIDVDDI